MESRPLEPEREEERRERGKKEKDKEKRKDWAGLVDVWDIPRATASFTDAVGSNVSRYNQVLYKIHLPSANIYICGSRVLAESGASSMNRVAQNMLVCHHREQTANRPWSG